MFEYHAAYPVAFELGPLKVHWYGLMYVIGLALAWLLASWRVRCTQISEWTQAHINDLAFYAMLGVILGGRIGYMLFYNFSMLLADPLSLFKVWQGGMSFHGGFLGVLVSVWLFARKYQKSFIAVTDFIAPVAPLGIAAGRLGNFINGELWGRVTDVPWGVIFTHVDTLPRHPSSLYAVFLEGILLFVFLWKISAKPKPPGVISAWFLIGYGLARWSGEFFRQPDAHIGFIAFDWLTMGQLLTLPMLLIGIFMLGWSYSQKLIKKGR